MLHPTRRKGQQLDNDPRVNSVSNGRKEKPYDGKEKSI